MWAPDDPLFGLNYARRLGEEFPNATLVTVEDSRRFVQTDRPDALIAALRAFLDDRARFHPENSSSTARSAAATASSATRSASSSSTFR